MSREVSQEFRNALYAQETDEAFIILLDILTPEIEGGVLRLAGSWEEVVSNGNTYTPTAFRLSLPDDKEDSTPVAKLEIDNVDRRIGLAIREMRSQPEFIIRVVRASAPDEVEIEFTDFVLESCDINKLTVSGNIGVSKAINQTFPKDMYNPSLFPGMF